jgi:hypothetical protein
MTRKVKVNTSDTAWIQRRGTGEPVAYGTDIKGVVYFQAIIEVPAVEHVKFAGAAMIRFDLGADWPQDATRGAMYPESYLVA